MQIRANENIDVVEEGYDSSKDEISSISSYNPNRGNTDLPYRTLSLQSIASRLSNNDFHQLQSDRTVPSYVPLTQLSVAEVMDDSGAGIHISSTVVRVVCSDIFHFLVYLSFLPFFPLMLRTKFMLRIG